jgi:hypothetical protein
MLCIWDLQKHKQLLSIAPKSNKTKETHMNDWHYGMNQRNMGRSNSNKRIQEDTSQERLDEFCLLVRISRQ